jgi:hypothetical protein
MRRRPAGGEVGGAAVEGITDWTLGVMVTTGVGCGMYGIRDRESAEAWAEDCVGCILCSIVEEDAAVALEEEDRTVEAGKEEDKEEDEEEDAGSTAPPWAAAAAPRVSMCDIPRTERFLLRE